MNTKIALYIGFVILTVLSRVVEHPANFTAVMALALFLGARLENKTLGLVLTLIPMVIVDSYLGFHSTTFFVYGALVAILFISRFGLAGKKLFPLGISSIAFGILFYLITNFGVWQVDGMYPHTYEGLLLCYRMGIPFLKNQIIGDLFYTLVFVGAFDYLSHKISRPQKVR